MDGLDFIVITIHDGVIKNATLKIDGKPHNFGYRNPMKLSDWIDGFRGTDPKAIDGIIRFAKQTGGGGFIVSQGVATPIAPVGAPRRGDVRRSFSVTLRSEVDEWLRSQPNMADVVRRAIDRAYKENQNQP